MLSLNRLVRSVTSLRGGVLVLGLVSWLAPGRAVAQDLYALQDRLAIAEQLAQYSYRWDSKNSEGFANLFTADGAMGRGRDGTLVTGSRVVGRQAILEYARTSHQGRLADRQTRHHFSALVFLELTADSAVTENMALITHQTAADSGPVIQSSGIYRITWVKQSDGWEMAKRMLFTDSFTSP